MNLPASTKSRFRPRTEAVRRALHEASDTTSIKDLLFFESWQMQATPDVANILRAGQIRRANPRLADEILAELRSGPLLGARKGAARSGRRRAADFSA